jgi:hypothetical protein
MVPGKLSGVEANRKDLSELIDAKWPDGNGDALEQPVGK